MKRNYKLYVTRDARRVTFYTFTVLFFFVLTLSNSYGLTLLRSYGLPPEDPEACETAIETINHYVAFLKCIEEKPVNECDNAKTLELTTLSQCKEACDYLQELINKEKSEPIRCGLIRFLGWTGDVEFVPFLKELLKKEKLSVNEKSHILFAFCQIGKHSDNKDIIDNVVRLTDEFCKEQNGLDYDCTNSDCAQLYYYLGGEAALNYFSYCFENEETRLSAALKLAFLGEYEKTLPVFAAAIFSENRDDILIALQGLKAIGTEAAYLLIKSQTQHEDVAIALTAQKFCTIFEKKGGKL